MVDPKHVAFEYWLTCAEDPFGEASRGDLHSGGRGATAPCLAGVLGVGVKELCHMSNALRPLPLPPRGNFIVQI